MKKNVLTFSLLSKKNIFLLSAAAAIWTLQSCDESTSSSQNSETAIIKEATKGTVTELEEVKPGNTFKIIDERIIDEKEKSTAIVHYLSGKTDTVALDKIKTETQARDNSHSGLRNILLFSLASSFFSRNMGNSAPNPAFYKNPEAYSKSSGLRSEMERTATTRRVSTPRNTRSGYGSGKSFRSYGG